MAIDESRSFWRRRQGESRGRGRAQMEARMFSKGCGLGRQGDRDGPVGAAVESLGVCIGVK